MFISEVMAATVQEETTFSGGIMDLIWGSGPLVKLVLLVLAGFSIMSWAIIIFKYFFVKNNQKATLNFLDKYSDCENLDTMYVLAKETAQSSVSTIYLAAYREMQKLAKVKSEFKPDLENITRAMNKAHNSQVNKLGEHLTYIGTTASACPFIGLFGTVWGIMNSFRAIGRTGSASLATVAPGISEALITTAVGLMAAIPAIIFYNYFVNKNNMLNNDMRNFKADILNLIKRNF